jgi:hypothetical protein
MSLGMLLRVLIAALPVQTFGPNSVPHQPGHRAGYRSGGLHGRGQSMVGRYLAKVCPRKQQCTQGLGAFTCAQTTPTATVQHVYPAV